eukprot:TRINITY_DN513_c0_g3_i1.p1 TRINITY_DN513_c0_g3~~TRINITY_DN513_c0_g3_i1.p1  ORF type:complete len:1398 (+),score=599.25 TRINITY_DN513_c0_g3_i1:85-4194(+)
MATADGEVAPDAAADGKQDKQEDRRRMQDNLRPYHSLGFHIPHDSLIGGKVIEHTGDESIVYLSGRHVAIYSYEAAAHRFIPKHPRTLEIVAFAVSHNRRYIALSERVVDEESADGHGIQISIYNFNTATRMRTLPLSKIGKQSVESLDFSRDNKYMVSVSAPPDPFIHFWQLDKARLLRFTELRQRVSKVSISPWAHWTMCTTGTTALRIWRYQDKELRAVDPVPKRTTRDYHFTTHSWFDDDRLCVGTEEGDILVIDGGELKKVIANIFGTMGQNPYAVWTISCVGRGFVCGGEGGEFAVYERTYDAEYFQCYKHFTTPGRKRIIDISISPNEENLICCYENNELALFSLANVDVMDHDKEEEVAQAFRNLPVGFHCDVITGFDVCIQKSIIVTTSMDRTIRVWNFLKKRLEIRKECEEEALTVSVHPTGTRILVGFKPRMCMYNVLIDDLHMCQEFPIKQCREVRFSNGGQLFAAVVVNRIFIFDAYTFEALGHLTGHSSMVKSFSWVKNDTAIVSCGFEGAVYEWKTDNCKRNESNEYVHKSIAFSTVCYDDASQLVTAVGSHKVADPPNTPEGEVSLRVLKLNEEPSQIVKTVIRLGTAENKHTHTRSHTREVALSVSAQCLFAGTPSGQLLVYRWQPKGSGSSIPAEPDITLDLHRGELWFLTLSLDDRYLFTVGEDKCCFMFDVESLLTDARSAGPGAAPRKQTFNYNLFDDVAFVLHQDIDDRLQKIHALQTQLSEEQRARKQEKENIEAHYSALLQQTEIDARKAIEEARAGKEAAERERKTTEQRMLDEARGIESQRMRDIQELEALHSKRVKDQTTRYERVSEEKADLIVRYENKILKMTKEREAEQRRFEHEMRALQESKDRLSDQMSRDHQLAIAESEGVLKDTEDEHEKELQQLEKKYQEMLDEKTKAADKAQGDADTCKRRFDKYEQEKKENLKLLKEHRKDLDRRDAEIQDLKKSIQTLKLEINVRNDTISASEKKILELKKQTAELEKLRYVLTFKFNELRKEVAPKEDTIKQMNERIQQMDEEIERIGTDRDMMSQKITGKEEKNMVAMREICRLHRQIEDQHRMVQLLLTDLSELVTGGEERRMVYGVRDIIDRYTAKIGKQTEAPDKAKMAEFERQRFYMEAQLSTLKKQNIRREEHMRADGLRKTAENALLVREINELRHEKKLLTQRLQLADSQVKEARMTSAQRGSAAGSPRTASPPAAAGGRGSPQPSGHFAGAALTADAAGSPRGPSRASSRKGKLARGSTRSLRDISRMDPAKIAELIELVDHNNHDIMRQQEEIQRLRDFVQHLLLRQKAESAGEGPAVGQSPGSSPTRRPPGQSAATPPPGRSGVAVALPNLPPRPASDMR